MLKKDSLMVKVTIMWAGRDLGNPEACSQCTQAVRVPSSKTEDDLSALTEVQRGKFHSRSSSSLPALSAGVYQTYISGLLRNQRCGKI